MDSHVGTVTWKISARVVVKSASMKKEITRVRADLTLAVIRGNANTNKVMISILFKMETEQDRAMSAWHTASVDSGDTSHMAAYDSILSVNRKPSSGPTATAKSDGVQVKTEGTFKFQLSAWTGPVKLDHVVPFQKYAQNVVSIAFLCDDVITVQFTKYSFVIKMKRNFMIVHRWTDRMRFQAQVWEQQSPATPNAEICVLDVWHAKLGQADRPAAKWMREEGVFRM